MIDEKTNEIENEVEESATIQTSVYPDREIYKRAKARMAMEGDSLTRLVNKWLREYVEEWEEDKE